MCYWYSPYPPPRLRWNDWRGRAGEGQLKKPRKSVIMGYLEMFLNIKLAGFAVLTRKEIKEDT
jgi:hypothetical protein